jgi:phosphatidylglycerol:prolipoprotein diacylglycerol transferase
MTLSAWLHDLSPFALRLTESFGVRWYGLSYALAFLIGWLLLKWLARIGFARIPQERAGDAILYAVVGVIVGGRLGYVLIYQRALLWTISRDPPWWGVLAINQGGMASHGGMIGVILSAFVIARGFKDRDGVRHGAAPVRHILDCFALLTPFGLLLGRLANFINGELLGRIYALPGRPAPFWTVRYPQEIHDEYLRRVGILKDQPPIHTDAQWAQVSDLVERFRLPGMTFEAATDRMLSRLQRGDPSLAAQLAQLISARYPSQLLQAAAEGLVVGAVVWLVAARPRLPGVIGCWFLISYGILRVLTELVRLPDSNVNHPHILGLSRGQWLSLIMVIAGLAILFWIRRRGGEKMGGWPRTRKSGRPL